MYVTRFYIFTFLWEHVLSSLYLCLCICQLYCLLSSSNMRNVCGTVFNRPRESGTFLQGILQSLQKVIILAVINIIIFESSLLHHHHDQHWPQESGTFLWGTLQSLNQCLAKCHHSHRHHHWYQHIITIKVVIIIIIKQFLQNILGEGTNDGQNWSNCWLLWDGYKNIGMLYYSNISL